MTLEEKIKMAIRRAGTDKSGFFHRAEFLDIQIGQQTGKLKLFHGCEFLGLFPNDEAGLKNLRLMVIRIVKAKIKRDIEESKKDDIPFPF